MAIEEFEKEHHVKVDEGNVIDGPFIPDGRVRIYDPETNRVHAEALTVEGAMANYKFYSNFT